MVHWLNVHVTKHTAKAENLYKTDVTQLRHIFEQSPLFLVLQSLLTIQFQVRILLSANMKDFS